MIPARSLLCALLAFLAIPLWAQDYDPALAAGATCTVAIADLHPTQFCVGMEEVTERTEKLREMKPKKLASYVAEHIVPIVIGPRGVPYIIDHHHFALAMERSGLMSTVPAKIMANYRTLEPTAFWAQMKAHGWVYLSRAGTGPLPVVELPAHLDGLTNDPYRSLVWSALKADPTLDKDETPFADFKWADVLRAHIKMADTPEGYEAAIPAAAKLMHGPQQ